MSFSLKSALKTTTATALVAGSVMIANSAQAATLTAGSFTLTGGGVSRVTNYSGSGDTTFTLNFDLTPLSVSNAIGVFSIASLTGTPNVATLNLTQTAPGQFAFAAVNNFITGLKQNGENIFLDLNAGVLNGFIATSTNYSFGSTLLGTLRDSSGNNVLANGSLASFDIGLGPGANQSSITVTTTAVPTPALLPGFLALGVGMVRKRKAQEKALTNAEA